MSRNKAFQKIARDKGILSPEVSYERQEKAYSIRILISNPHGVGFTNPAVGIYTSIAEAEEQLEADIQAFILRYPSAIDKVTQRYHIVTEEDSVDSQDSRRETARHLLSALQNPGHVYYLDSQIATLAKETMNYIRELESRQAPSEAKGTYSSRLPEQPKSAIAWQQPRTRQHPVYIFDFTCPYCGEIVSLERHSPREPKHCEKKTCSEEHRRILARNRKRKQRAKDDQT